MIPKCRQIEKKFDYSIKEQVIGKWIDGSNLYRAVIKTTIPTVNTEGTSVWQQVKLPKVKYGKVVSCDMRLISNAGISYQSILHYTSTNNQSLYLRAYFSIVKSNNNGLLEIVSNNTQWNGNEIIAIVEYTKLEDN